MSNPLTPLLEILKNPDHPSFAQAVERLATLDPATLPRDEAPQLLAQLEATLASLTQSRNLTAQQLGKLRQSGSALQSYNLVK